MSKLIICLILLSNTTLLFASQDNLTIRQELPEPLSFNDTLLFAKKQYHHSFLLSQSAIASAKATSSIYGSDNDITISLIGYLRKVGVSEVATNLDDNDSKVSLIAKKIIYDFGLSSSKEKLAELLLKVKIIEFNQQQDDYLNQVVKAYFNVLKSDNEYLVHNENMSVAFIRFDRTQENAELGLSSDLDILEVQSAYEKVRQQRFLGEAQQRFTRQNLAELLGSTSVPDQLETPAIDIKRRLINDVELLIDLALKNSKKIKLQQAKINVSKQAIKVASHELSANIEAEFEVSEYAKQTSFRDEWRASINFNVPLYSGRKMDSSMMLAQANLQAELSYLQKGQSELRLKVLELWQQIKQKTLELEGAIVKQEYRDLYLEQSRADYELEYQSDLGDAMVQYSRSRTERYDIEFDLEMAWLELIMLVGQNNKMKIQRLAAIR